MRVERGERDAKGNKGTKERVAYKIHTHLPIHSFTHSCKQLFTHTQSSVNVCYTILSKKRKKKKTKKQKAMATRRCGRFDVMLQKYVGKETNGQCSIDKEQGVKKKKKEGGC